MKPLFPGIFPSTPSDRQAIAAVPENYWSIPVDQILSTLHTTEKGLTQQDAEGRLRQYGCNALEERREATALILFLSQFKSPLVLILIFAAIVSIMVGEWTDASLVLVVVFGSTILGFILKYNASNAVENCYAPYRR